MHGKYHFNLFRRPLLGVLLAGATAFASVPPAAIAAVPAARAGNSADKADALFLAARDAYRGGEALRLARAVDALQGHPLAAWAESWQLRLRLDEDNNAGVEEFLRRHAGSYVADKLRGDWLRWLAKRGDWDTFKREFPALVQADDEVRCYAALAAGDSAALRALWLEGKDFPAACEAPVARLVADGQIPAEDVWQRVRRLLEAKKVGAARQAAGYLPAGGGFGERASRELEAIAQSPARYLARLPEHLGGSRGAHEMALFAVQRLARSDALEAARRLERIEAQLRPEERAYGWAHVAQWAAMFHRPEALAWYEKAQATALAEEQLAWRVRASLRAYDWDGVQRAIAAMPAAQAAQPDWVYWRARSLVARGHADEARGLYQQIAGQASFYGNLADEELGRSITVPPIAAEASAEEFAAATANPAFQRALALFRVEMRVEGVREWVYALRGMDDRQLLAAAAFAHSQEIWDRAINTADRTRQQHDFRLRYVAPFSDQVRPQARRLDLDDGWVYGLMRQESRFVMNAKSSAGAKGLMQLMPATAKWVAKKINLANYSPSRVTDMDVNVTLGTHYMKMVLESLDNHPVLASAAYNAGPGRAKRWRAERPLEGAIYAETIPFSETRDYVKKVMSNAVYYSALFEQRPQSLKARLGTIRARGEGERGVDDLP